VSDERPASSSVSAIWTSGHALLVALTLFSVDVLLLKFTRPWTDWLPVALLAILGIVAVLSRVARRTVTLKPRRLQRIWAALDGPGFVWVAFLFVLLVVFHGAFDRASGDGREYYAQLHSIVFDRDLNFLNEARDFGADEAGIFPFGSAWLWLPFYLLAHAWLLTLNLFGAGLRHEGYYYPYQMAVGLGTLGYGFAGLVLAYRIACDYFSKWLSLAAALVVCVGSFVFWYLAVDSSYTHGNSLFTVTLFLFLWHRTRAHRTVRGWWWLGVAGGLMTMVRWQNAVFLAPLAIDILMLLRGARGSKGELIGAGRRIGAGAAGVFVAFLPQMYFWKRVHGGWLAVPHNQAGQQWWADSLMLDVLFSPNHGLLSWHPVLYLSLLGVPIFFRRDRTLASVLVALFGVQVYVNGAVTTWWGGSAFGGRRFDGCVLLFVLGLAALLRWGRDRPAVIWTGSLGVLLAGNLLFMREMRAGRMTMDEAIGVERIVAAAVERVGNPFSFPANALFQWQTGLEAGAYDRLGVRRYNNAQIDIGTPGDTEFLGSGWADRERNAEMTFRWAVTERSTLGLALMGPRYIRPGEPYALSDYRIRFRAAPFEYPEAPPQTIALRINGVLIANLTMDAGVREYGFDVPGRVLRRSLNAVTFDYGYARAPREVKVSDDTRRLAVLFDYIYLEQKRVP
jgi:hypothetical protein